MLCEICYCSPQITCFSPRWLTYRAKGQHLIKEKNPDGSTLFITKHTSFLSLLLCDIFFWLWTLQTLSHVFTTTVPPIIWQPSSSSNQMSMSGSRYLPLVQLLLCHWVSSSDFCGWLTLEKLPGPQYYKLPWAKNTGFACCLDILRLLSFQLIICFL